MVYTIKEHTNIGAEQCSCVRCRVGGDITKNWLVGVHFERFFDMINLSHCFCCFLTLLFEVSYFVII
jgi:hypothetical protein